MQDRRLKRLQEIAAVEPRSNKENDNSVPVDATGSGHRAKRRREVIEGSVLSVNNVSQDDKPEGSIPKDGSASTITLSPSLLVQRLMGSSHRVYMLLRMEGTSDARRIGTKGLTILSGSLFSVALQERDSSSRREVKTLFDAKNVVDDRDEGGKRARIRQKVLEARRKEEEKLAEVQKQQRVGVSVRRANLCKCRRYQITSASGTKVFSFELF